MRYNLLIALLSLLMVAGCTDSTDTDEDFILVSGTVSERNQEGDLVPLASVVIRVGGKLAVTEDDGKYKVTLSPGEYEMRADRRGYEPFRDMIEITVDMDSLDYDIIMVKSEQ